MNGAVAGLVASSAGIILLCMIVGAFLLSRDRATATEMVLAKNLDETLRGGYLRKVARLDREDWYVWMQIGLMMVGQGIVLRPSPAYPLSNLDAVSNNLLGMTMILGSMFALVGSAIGLPWLFPRESDLRVPYALGFFGQFAVLNSVAAYAVVITFHSADMVGTLGGGVAIVISCASAQRLWRFAREIYLRTKMLIRLRRGA